MNKGDFFFDSKKLFEFLLRQSQVNDWNSLALRALPLQELIFGHIF